MPEQPVGLDIEALARRLDEAWENREPIAPLTESDGLAVDQSYAVQSRWTGMRLERGERLVGRKIGLTSPAMQEQMGVNEPDYGSLWASRYYPAQTGRTEIPADVFLQPRVEGEIAFLIGKPLEGTNVTPQEVLVATEALAVAVEVVDSRIEDWRIKLPDTIADNASYGGFTLGPWSRSLREADLRTLGMLIHQNGQPVVQGIGAAALGGPARAVAWLANKLTSFGVKLEPGDIVLSGALGRATPAEKGDVFVLEAYGQPPLTVIFS
ncbi:MAG: fumarylacetoacetate hydrolase family protein [Actinomycetota bacterium]